MFGPGPGPEAERPGKAVALRRLCPIGSCSRNGQKPVSCHHLNIMGEGDNKLKESLEKSVAMVDNELLNVAKDLGFEEDNLDDLVSEGDTATREHLVQLKSLIEGLRSRLSDLREELVKARTMAGALGSLEELGEVSGSLDQDADVDIEPREASKMRHDEPISLGVILRSLLMANEPAQRERYEKEEG